VRLILSVIVLALIVMQTLSIEASLAPGLSVKNALIYLAAASIIVRMVLAGNFRPQLVGLQGCFLFLLAYATISWLIALLAIRYPGYEFLASVIHLKNGLYDHAIFFIVFFYAAQTLDDALAVTDVLLFGVIAANIVTVLDASGVLGWNIIPVRTENLEEIGRVQGAFGESNQHAAIAVLLLPALLAKAVLTRGVVRAFWGIGALFSVAAIFMTASRGAMLGIVLACLWGAFIFRRFVSLGRLTGWLGVGVLFVTIVLLSLSATYTELLSERVLGITFSGDAVSASSGRTEIWAGALRRMAESPWTFITGFGWNVYSSMDFDYAPHNTYLGYWFNLGLPGLLAVLLIIAQALFTARAAAEVAPRAQRPYMIAFVVGFLGLCISVFFVEMTEPWLYVWAYVGLTMRAAVILREQASEVGRADQRDPEGRPGLGRPQRARTDIAAIPRRPRGGLGSPATPVRGFAPLADRGPQGDRGRR
jgi:O-antigen ligase